MAIDDAQPQITIDVQTRYEDGQSAPEEQRYVFSYHIDIRNNGPEDIQLIKRHWTITDGNGQVHEVEGEGVIGEQPDIKVLSTFSYTSGAVLETAVGSMAGYYTMRLADGTTFKVDIPIFTLATPKALH